MAPTFLEASAAVSYTICELTAAEASKKVGATQVLMPLALAGLSFASYSSSRSPVSGKPLIPAIAGVVFLGAGLTKFVGRFVSRGTSALKSADALTEGNE